MAQPIIVPLSPGITVETNYTLRLTALNPTTGALVSGVTVSLAQGLGTNVEAPTVIVNPAQPPILVPGPGS